MTEARTTEDPAAIERDIRRTQEDMSRTVDRIGNQLTMRNIFNALLDKADENDVDARMLVDGARRNPIALGLIAAGTIWLVSDKDSKFPSMPHKSKSGGRQWDDDHSDFDVHHRDYVAHMSTLDMRDGEDPMAWQRRRDQHRANFMMCERRQGEDDHSFRQRLDELTDKFREKRQAWSVSASRTSSATGQSARRTAQRASSKAQDMFDSNPMVGGILAAALGAALGSTIPVTRTEQEKLGDLGHKARDMAGEQKEQLTSQLQDKKDELVGKAEQALKPSGQGQSGSSPTGQSGSERKPADAPFILPERTN